jgi:hypothetical protein
MYITEEDNMGERAERLYRAVLTSGEILEGSFKTVYKISLSWCKETHASAEIYDAWQADWCRLNSLTPVPHTSIHTHEGIGIWVMGPTSRDVWYNLNN